MSMYKKIKDLATFYENNGLNREKNNTYIVLGDTYSIKDLLKEIENQNKFVESLKIEV